MLGLRLINLACPQTAVQTLIGPKIFKCEWVSVCLYVCTKDRYLHSIFFLSRGQTANQTMRAMTRAKPMEMSSTPHQGSLSKPSTAVPSRRKEEREQEGCRGRGGEERKGAFETTGSMCYHQHTALGNEQGHCGLLVVSNGVGDKH